MIGTIFLMALCVSAWAAGTEHNISGRVVDTQTGKPLARASVTVQFKEETNSPVVLTGEDGVFHVLNLPDGPLTLIASRHGYLGAETTVHIGSDTPAPITLQLTRQSVIRGVVIGDGNAPIRGAQVLLEHAEGEPQKFVVMRNTDDAGEFRLGNLRAGRYLVAAVGGVACAPKGMEYGKRYYPNVIARGEAKRIDLEVGQDADVKIQLSATPMREVRGRVTPMVPGARARILELDWTNIFQEWDEGSQTFRFYNLPSGEYILRASGELDGKQLSATQTIVIRDADINGIVLELHENR
jgi:hypothetical protein